MAFVTPCAMTCASVPGRRPRSQTFRQTAKRCRPTSVITHRRCLRPPSGRAPLRRDSKRREEDPERVGRFDAALRQQLAQREGLEVRERPRPIGVGKRSPFDADVGERRHLGRAKGRHLLRREELDLVRLHLLGQAARLAVARHVETREREKREVREQQQEYDGSQGLSTKDPRAGQILRVLGRGAPGTKGSARRHYFISSASASTPSSTRESMTSTGGPRCVAISGAAPPAK